MKNRVGWEIWDLPQGKFGRAVIGKPTACWVQKELLSLPKPKEHPSIRNRRVCSREV